MDDVERALIDGYFAAGGRLLSKDRDPGEVARVARRASSKVVSGNLRSWALALRACDGRIPEENGQGVVGVTGARVREWCGPVAIAGPGVSLSEAARLFGVNRTTVSRWADPAPEVRTGRDHKGAGGVEASGGVGCAKAAGLGRGRARVTWKRAIDRQIEAAEVAAAGCRFGPPSSYRVVGRRLVLDYTVNRANRKRDVVRVWTPMAYGVDPGGEVWSADWGEVRRGLVDRVPDGFEQVLTRVDRRLSGRSRVWQWVCPVGDGGCGRLVYKLYWPMAVWTVGAAFGEGEAGGCLGAGGETGGEAGGETGGEPPFAGGEGFLCGGCCGLVYESSERGSWAGARGDGGRRRVDVWDRYVKRASGGVLTGRDVSGRGG